MSDSRDLLREIESFIEGRKMAPSTFGRMAVNDGKLIARLRNGGDLTMEKAAQVRKFIAQGPSANVTVDERVSQ